MRVQQSHNGRVTVLIWQLQRVEPLQNWSISPLCYVPLPT